MIAERNPGPKDHSPTKDDVVAAFLANDVRDNDRQLGIRSGGLVEASLEDLLERKSSRTARTGTPNSFDPAVP